jgi:acyl carrier protein
VNEDAIRDTLTAALRTVAPEADPAVLRGDEPIQDQLEIDSMDFLNWVIAIHERTGVDIPERDYRRVATLDDAVAYVAAALRRA